MTIEEMKAARLKAEQDILAILRAFERASGLKVDRVDLQGTEWIQGGRLTTEVRIALDL